MRKLVLIGAADFAEVVCEYFTRDSDHVVVAYAVEAAHLTGTSRGGLPVVPLEDLAAHFPPDAHDAHVAVGGNWLRERLMAVTAGMGYRLASYVSSRAVVWPTVPVGRNALIMEMNVVQHGASIGEGVVLSSGNHVGHHSRIGDLCFLSSHVVVAGRCRIGRRTFVGVNAAFADDIEIGDDCFVGMSAAVGRSFPEAGRILIGSPATATATSTYEYFGVAP